MATNRDRDAVCEGWVVYILLCGDGTLYTGISNDLPRRLRAHDLGRTGARYTRGRGPLRLVYVEDAEDRGTALRREAAIKRLSRHEKSRLALAGARRRKLEGIDPAALRELRRSLPG